MSDNGFEMVRYADDFVVLCRSEFEAEVALQMITEWVEAAGLTLHPTKTKIVDSRVESFAFLGYSFRGEKIYPRRESLAKMKARIKELTPRKRAGSIQMIAAELNSVLRGWFGHFRHCRWTIFKDLDEKIRSRLRRLLLKRHKNNPEHLSRTHRWPNDFFTKAGLYSLREAHFRFDQSVAGDLSFGMLQVIAQSLWWFHPAVWFSNCCLSREAERCCDEQVIAELGCSPGRYARSLLAVIESKHSLQAIPVFPGMKPVEITTQRMERIMSLKNGLNKRTPLWCWLAVAALALVVLPGAIAKPTPDGSEPKQPTEDSKSTNEPKGRITQRRFEGNKRIATADLEELLTLKPGDEWNSIAAAADIRKIRSRYSGLTRTESVNPVPHFQEQPGVFDLVFEIDEELTALIRLADDFISSSEMNLNGNSVVAFVDEMPITVDEIIGDSVITQMEQDKIFRSKNTVCC